MATIIGTYSNGAVRLARWIDSHGTPYEITWYAFPDCPTCNGTGRVYKPGLLWSGGGEKDCPDCARRFGAKPALKEAILEVIAQVKSEVNGDKRTGVKVTDPHYIEVYNTTNPLAAEYRKLLKAWWTYQEPAFTPA